MCDQTQVSYLPGDIVWVKLSNLWWPAEVQNEDELDEEVTGGLKKKPLAVVKFFNEDSYEFPKNLDQIYHYNCLRKDEFIKRGLELKRASKTNRSVPSSIDKFPLDVALAEEKTNGDPAYIDDPKFAPPVNKRLDTSISKDVTPAKKMKLEEKKPTPILKRGKSTKTSSSPRVHFCVTKGNKIATPKNLPKKKPSINGVPQSILKKTTPTNKSFYRSEYCCLICEKNIIHNHEVMLSHMAQHYSGILPGRPPVIPKRYQAVYDENVQRVKKSPGASANTNSVKAVRKRKKAEENLSPKKKKKKKSDLIVEERKICVVSPSSKDSSSVISSKKQSKKEKIKAVEVTSEALELLKDWDEVSDDEGHKQTDAKLSKEVGLPSGSGVPPNTDGASALTNTANTDTKSCFDFEDNDDSLHVDHALKFGQKLPRVITDKQSANRKSTNSKSDDLPDDLSKEVDNFLKTIEVPQLVEISQKTLNSSVNDSEKKSSLPEKKHVSGENETDLKSFSLSSEEADKNIDFKKSLSASAHPSSIELTKDTSLPEMLTVHEIGDDKSFSKKEKKLNEDTPGNSELEIDSHCKEKLDSPEKSPKEVHRELTTEVSLQLFSKEDNNGTDCMPSSQISNDICEGTSLNLKDMKKIEEQLAGEVKYVESLRKESDLKNKHIENSKQAEEVGLPQPQEKSNQNLPSLKEDVKEIKQSQSSCHFLGLDNIKVNPPEKKLDGFSPKKNERKSLDLLKKKEVLKNETRLEKKTKPRTPEEFKKCKVAKLAKTQVTNEAENCFKTETSDLLSDLSDGKEMSVSLEVTEKKSKNLKLTDAAINNGKEKLLSSVSEVPLRKESSPKTHDVIDKKAKIDKNVKLAEKREGLKKGGMNDKRERSFNVLEAGDKKETNRSSETVVKKVNTVIPESLGCKDKHIKSSPSNERSSRKSETYDSKIAKSDIEKGKHIKSDKNDRSEKNIKSERNERSVKLEREKSHEKESDKSVKHDRTPKLEKEKAEDKKKNERTEKKEKDNIEKEKSIKKEKVEKKSDRMKDKIEKEKVIKNVKIDEKSEREKHKIEKEISIKSEKTGEKSERIKEKIEKDKPIKNEKNDEKSEREKHKIEKEKSTKNEKTDEKSGKEKDRAEKKISIRNEKTDEKSEKIKYKGEKEKSIKNEKIDDKSEREKDKIEKEKLTKSEKTDEKSGKEKDRAEKKTSIKSEKTDEKSEREKDKVEKEKSTKNEKMTEKLEREKKIEKEKCFKFEKSIEKSDREKSKIDKSIKNEKPEEKSDIIIKDKIEIEKSIKIEKTDKHEMHKSKSSPQKHRAEKIVSKIQEKNQDEILKPDSTKIIKKENESSKNSLKRDTEEASQKSVNFISEETKLLHTDHQELVEKTHEDKCSIKSDLSKSIDNVLAIDHIPLPPPLSDRDTLSSFPNIHSSSSVTSENVCNLSLSSVVTNEKHIEEHSAYEESKSLSSSSLEKLSPSKIAPKPPLACTSLTQNESALIATVAMSNNETLSGSISSQDVLLRDISCSEVSSEINSSKEIFIRKKESDKFAVPLSGSSCATLHQVTTTEQPKAPSSSKQTQPKPSIDCPESMNDLPKLSINQSVFSLPECSKIVASSVESSKEEVIEELPSFNFEMPNINFTISPAEPSANEPFNDNSSLKQSNDCPASEEMPCSVQANSSLTAQDIASLDITSMPIELEPSDSFNMDILYPCNDPEQYPTVPGSRILTVYLRRKGEPFPEKVAHLSNNKFTIKNDPESLSNISPGLQKLPFPVYKPVNEAEKRDTGEVSSSSPIVNTSEPSKEKISMKPFVSNGDTKFPILSSTSFSSLQKTSSGPFTIRSAQDTKNVFVTVTNSSKVRSNMISTLKRSSLKAIKLVEKSGKCIFVAQNNMPIATPVSLGTTQQNISTKNALTSKSINNIIVSNNPLVKKPNPKPAVVSVVKNSQSNPSTKVKPSDSATKVAGVFQSKSKNVINIKPNIIKTVQLPSTSTPKANNILIENKQPTKIGQISPNILQKSPRKPVKRNSLSKTEANSSSTSKLVSVGSNSLQSILQKNVPPSSEPVIYLAFDSSLGYQTVSSSTPVSVQSCTPGVKVAGKMIGSQKIKNIKPAGQDILAEALANTQVLQSDLSDLESYQFVSTPSTTSLTNSVLETSLTLNQPPIMTPLEVPSSVATAIPVLGSDQTVYLSEPPTFQLIVTQQENQSCPQEQKLIVTDSSDQLLKPKESLLNKEENVLPEFFKEDITKKHNVKKPCGDR